jgi:L-fucose isomerase-like protein
MHKGTSRKNKKTVIHPSVVPRAGFGPVIDGRRMRNSSITSQRWPKNEKDVYALIGAGFEYFCDFETTRSSENVNTKLHIARTNQSQFSP